MGTTDFAIWAHDIPEETGILRDLLVPGVATGAGVSFVSSTSGGCDSSESSITSGSSSVPKLSLTTS